MVCDNFRGIAVLNMTYKVFSKILLGRLEPIAEECKGNYQCGFRKGRSTIDQLSITGQLMEKNMSSGQISGRYS